MKKYKQRNKMIIPLLISVISLFISAFFYFGLVGYAFTAFLFLGVSLLIWLFMCLHILEQKYPKPLRLLRFGIITLIILVTVVFSAAEVFIIRASKGYEEPLAKYVLVLGAGLDGTVPSYSLQSRLRSAADYLDAHPESIAVVSGGQGVGEDIPEAEAMRTWLIDRGIDEDRIITEDESTSTLENIRFSQDAVRETGGDFDDGLVIVTSEYHVYRAEKFAESLGIDAFGVPAKTYNPFLMVNYFIREGFAVIFLWLTT